MEKTLASLMITLVVSVMGIPIAYLVGQRSAQHALRDQYQSELERTRSEHREEIAAIRSEMLESIRSQARNDQATRDALTSAGIRMPKPAATEALPSEGVPPPIPVETFEAAALGATYDEVVRTFGREGVATLTLEDGAGQVTTQYVWDWRANDGTQGRINLEFVDGRLNDKTFKE
jgi:hypothetical protein